MTYEQLLACAELDEVVDSNYVDVHHGMTEAVKQTGDCVALLSKIGHNTVWFHAVVILTSLVKLEVKLGQTLWPSCDIREHEYMAAYNRPNKFQVFEQCDKMEDKILDVHDDLADLILVMDKAGHKGEQRNCVKEIYLQLGKALDVATTLRLQAHSNVPARVWEAREDE